jgi:phosphoribosylamine-glycine ligase
MKRRGADVGIYIHNPQYRKNYRGIMPIIPFADLKKKLKAADLVIFDITHPNEKSKWDISLLKTFGISAGSPSVFGPVADKLKKGHKVIGASSITEDLELDRKKGIELAEKMGFAIPEMHTFKKLKDGAKFLESRKDLWVFKPQNNQDLDLTYVEKFPGELLTKILEEYNQRIGDKCEFLLQKKINGAEVSTEVWIAGGPVHMNQTIENKRLMDADLGPAIGSQSNTVWIKQDKEGPVMGPLVKMAMYLAGNGYSGPCDANCIIKGGVPYFLEWSPRFGWDALYCLLTLLKGSITDFFENDFQSEFHAGYAASQRLSIPPYPYGLSQLRSLYAKDVSVLGKLKDYPMFWAQDVYDETGLKCAGADGILGVVSGRGKSLEEAWGRVYNAIKKIKVCSYVQYRTDGLERARKRIEKLKVA